MTSGNSIAKFGQGLRPYQRYGHFCSTLSPSQRFVLLKFILDISIGFPLITVWQIAKSDVDENTYVGTQYERYGKMYIRNSSVLSDTCQLSLTHSIWISLSFLH